jgi:cation:H+ antiporter
MDFEQECRVQLTIELPASNGKTWATMGLIALGAVPAAVLRLSGTHIDPIVAAFIYGGGIVCAAFLLSWAAEVAEMDISGSLAIAILALIAVLPEYTIEAVLAWSAGASYDPVTKEITSEMARAAANVTGANRLLIGLGWSLVILIYWLKRKEPLDIRGEMGLEITMLIIATAVMGLIVVFQEVSIILAVVLIGVYLAYLWISSTGDSEEPELIGAAAVIGALPVARRRAMVLLLLFFAAAAILLAAEPFVEGLIETGTEFGIDEFILIQWIAPLASESPEIIIAILFTLRSNPQAGLTTLVSSEVNQLTLLVGSITVIFSISAGQVLSFPLDDRQTIEFMLTAAVSLFALILIAPRVLGPKVGLVLLGLFVVHLFFSDPSQRQIFSYIYFGLAVFLVVVDRNRIRQLIPFGK